MITRRVNGSDHLAVHSLMNEWWGRDIQDLAQRFLFDHFGDTSFIIEDNNGEIVAFLIGFVSQAKRDEAYTHLAGVNPNYRERGIARDLYETFFQLMRARGVTRVSCITSPTNTDSIGFHTSIGFGIVPGVHVGDGVDVQKNHVGQGGDRVVFTRDISEI